MKVSKVIEICLDICISCRCSNWNC